MPDQRQQPRPALIRRTSEGDTLVLRERLSLAYPLPQHSPFDDLLIAIDVADEKRR